MSNATGTASATSAGYEPDSHSDNVAPGVVSGLEFLTKEAAKRLPLLHKAKAHSDKGEYKDKANILHALMVASPDEWEIDEDTGTGILGITHAPTGYRFHLPREKVTPGVKRSSMVFEDFFAKEADITDRADAWHPTEKAWRLVDVPTLLRLTAGREATRVAIDDIWGGETTSPGFSEERVAGTDTRHPILVDSYSEDPVKKYGLVDGRHRKIKLMRAGETEANVIHLTPEDIEAALVAKEATTLPVGNIIPERGQNGANGDINSRSGILTGPQAIAHALGKLDIDALEKEQQDIVRSKKVTKRPRAVAVLNTLEGLRRNNLKPSDLMLKSVPVIPPIFRPFRIVGSTFVPGDANELYQDLMRYRDGYKESVKELGESGSSDARLALYDSAKALFGYGDSPNPKILKRGIAGFLTQLTGVGGPKHSWVNSKMVAKPVDTVSRGTVTVNPELSMDEIGIPEELAWRMYGPFIQRHMVRNMGISGAQSVKNLKERNKEAKYALEQVMTKRPVVYSRAPAWHKFNTMAGHAKLMVGNSIQVNPYITAAQGMDFDGDQINAHVPAGQDAIDDANDVLMPSKMVWSPRKYDESMHLPKHESLLGMRSAQVRPAKSQHTFRTEGEALKAIEQGKVRLSDEIVIQEPEKIHASV